MKKKRISLLSGVITIVLIVSSMWIPAFADTPAAAPAPVPASEEASDEAQLYFVTDEAGILSEDEAAALETDAEALAEKYDFGIYIITVDDIANYVDAPDMETAAETIYLEYRLGETEDKNGLLLLLSMNSRQWSMFAFGFGNEAFTDYGKQYLSGSFTDDFGEDSWYTGLVDYQNTCESMLQSAVEGNPIDVDNKPQHPDARAFGIAACILIAFIIAFIVRGVLKNQLKSVAMETDARNFISGEGLKLSEESDNFSHMTQSRVYDPPNDNDSGGTTTRSSGGSSASGSF